MAFRLALLAIALAACGECGACGDGALAELESLDGGVERDFAQQQEQWQKAALGARFALGDGLRTRLGASATLRVFPDTAMRVEPDTLLRFAATAPEAPQRVSVETGSVEVETTDVALEIATAGGVARVAGGTKARVQMSESGARFDVEVGRVEVEEGGRRLAFEAGGSFALQVGKVVRELDEGPAAAAVASAPDVDAALPDADAMDEEVDGTPLRGRADWLLPAGTALAGVLPVGESVTVHVPEGSARLALALPCKGPSKLELMGPGGRVRGEPVGRIGLSLPPGSYSYRVTCPDGSAAPARGRLRVRRDAATQRLPRTAPEANVRADGRRYTVRYQNRLPELTFEWPDAPKATRYSLVLTQEGRTRRHAASRPRLKLPSGAVNDGQHSFRFEASGGKRSSDSSLRVVFDNTARTAALVSPPPGGFKRGATTTVIGVALRGSRVQVQDQPATVTSDGRFRVQLSAPGEAFVVRVQHPRSGIHYYVRQAAD